MQPELNGSGMESLMQKRSRSSLLDFVIAWRKVELLAVSLVLKSGGAQ
jgi:hypothetical protein